MGYYETSARKAKELRDAGKAVIMAIESSCDETAVAIVRDGREVVAESIVSQIELHKKFGGVVPEVASRKHIESIQPCIDDCLDKAHMGFGDIDAIGVTYGPGLVGALLIGVTAAKSLAYSLELPLIGVNHIEGHICANYLLEKPPEPPFLCLVASGGHTHLVFAKEYRKYVLLGATRDDAAGEALDKVARILGLDYPGGPNLERLARDGSPGTFKFPEGFKGEKHFDFTFSGLKTFAVNQVHTLESKKENWNKADMAFGFQEAVTAMLCKNLIRAAQEYDCRRIAIAGGVSANAALRSRITDAAKMEEMEFFCPELRYCTDNAAMIGCAAYYGLMAGNIAGLELNASPSLQMDFFTA